MSKQEKALAKIEAGLRDCGLEEKEVEGWMNFLKNYLKLKVSENKKKLS